MDTILGEASCLELGLGTKNREQLQVRHLELNLYTPRVKDSSGMLLWRAERPVTEKH